VCHLDQKRMGWVLRTTNSERSSTEQGDGMKETVKERKKGGDWELIRLRGGKAGFTTEWSEGKS